MNEKATAITLFKRFYILHTVMDYDPRVFLMTALFLACKVEGSALSLKEYLSKVPNAPSADRMMDLETQLCTGLRFQLKVHHPFSPLHGFFLDFQVFLQGLGVGDVSKNEADEKDTLANRMAVLVEAFHKATERVTQSLLTDACLLYSPSQIGLACLSWSLSSSSSKGKDVKSIEKAFDSYLSQTWRDEKPETVLQLRQRLDEINRLIEEGAAGTSTEMARSVDAKLKRCRNLYLVETSLVCVFIVP